MRNIVLITLDSLRADHCTFMGYKRETTPTIDRMAKEGLYFENAISSSVPTLPSMFGILTGDYALINADVFTGKVGEEWRREISSRKTLAEILSKKGYVTKAFVTNPFATKYFGLNKGFDSLHDPSETYNKKGGKLIEFVLRKKEVPLAGDNFFLKSGGVVSRVKSFLEILKVVITKDRLLTPWERYYDNIIEQVEQVEQEKPYFLWILLIDTHIPWVPRIKKWRGNELKNIYLCYKITKGLYKETNYLDENERTTVINAYDDAIYYSDLFINKLWKDLRDDDPIFIIHADHGEGFGEHGFYEHPPMLYEELIHVPLVIYNADRKGKVEEPVSLRGLAPTMLELIDEENEFSSESFLHGGEDGVISKVFDRNGRKITYRMKDWKFITGQKDGDELYYLKKDPHEQENLIDERPDLVREIRTIVENHVKQEMEMRRIRDRVSKLRGSGRYEK